MKHLLAISALLLSFNANAALIYFDASHTGGSYNSGSASQVVSDYELYLGSASYINEQGHFEGQIYNSIRFMVSNQMVGWITASSGATTYFKAPFRPNLANIHRVHLYPGLLYTVSMSKLVDKHDVGFVRLVAEDYVAPVPLPTAAFLLAPALIGFFALRRPRTR